MLAISTTWNSVLHSTMQDMLLEIKEVGFDAIELGYKFTPVQLDEILSLVKDMDMKVASVHNFCPMPVETWLNRFATDAYRLSSLNEKERRKAIDYTKMSIDTACKFSCGVVVVHAGTVELSQSLVKAPLNLYNQGKFGSKEYIRAKEKILAVRAAKKGPFLESLAKSFEEVLSYARSSGVKLGLETRYYLNEIPNLEETGYFLNLFQDKGLFYWHDMGHAEVGERLGVAAHLDYLKKFSDRLIGLHLHGIKGIDDHLAPFSGDFDFSKILPYLRKDLINVIEAHPPSTPQQLKEALQKLQQIIP